MISKTLSFLLAYFLSVLNFLVILSPITCAIIIKYLIGNDSSVYLLQYFILFVVAVVSAFMLLLFIFNFIFNRNVNLYKKQYKSYTKYSDLTFLRDIFEDLKEKFNCHSIELLINPSSSINACAVGGLRKQVVVLNAGLIKHYTEKSQSREEFLTHIKGILAHEFSHIINKDYFCGLLLQINERSLNIVSKIIFFICNTLMKIVAHIPIIGTGISALIGIFYRTVNYIVNFFYFKIVIKIYKFIQIQISKYIEFRADRQAGNVVGGQNMANTLALLGKSGWFNIFSSHPKTQNRVKKVSSIGMLAQQIRPVFMVNLFFYLSIFIMCFLTYKSFISIDYSRIKSDYIQLQHNIQNKKQKVMTNIQNFINNSGKKNGK